MLGNEKSSYCDQRELDPGGEYCTLNQLPKANGATQQLKLNLVTQTARQEPQSLVSKTRNNNQTLSPKRYLARSKSNPDHIYHNVEKQVIQPNGLQRTTGSVVVGPSKRNGGHTKIVGRRSTGSASARDQPPPLCYFAYLGKLNPARSSQRSRGRLPSAHDILADRPVILTSTTVVSTFATNAICRDFEELDRSKRHFDYNELLDCCTCMCCVKGLFYHCTKDSEDEGRLAEYPCSCQGPVSQCLARWGVMGLLSVVMPCLLCYLPFEACSRCYNCIKHQEKTKNRHQAPEMSSTSLESPPTALSMSNRCIDSQWLWMNVRCLFSRS